MRYLLSVVIPTRNREKYLLDTLKQVLKNTLDNVQIVIQDNSDTKSLESEINQLNVTRVKYNYQAQRLSFVDNFSRAIELADGQYITMIGDDDGVLPEINSFTKYANENGIEVLVPKVTFEYFWPGSIEINNSSDGVIRLLETKRKLQRVDGIHELKKLINNGFQDYVYYQTAKLYHGIVKKECLDKIHRITGRYFGGLTPDIYMAVALTLVSKSIYHLSIPLTIAGVCPGSGSAQSTNGLHVGSYEDAPHLYGHKTYEWSELVPKFYSVETIWADSAIAAIVDLGESSLLKSFSVEALTGRLTYLYKDYRKFIYSSYAQNTAGYSAIDRVISKIKLASYPYVYFLKKVMRRLSRLNKRLIFQNGVSSIAEATQIYSDKYSTSAK